MTLADTLRHLGLSAPDPRSDGELLSEFVRSRDEPAFAELLRRHGPTVYGVCHRIVGPTDADDAFQAVFLVLSRKANTVRPPGMVGNWLYGVAVRTANKARVMNAKRRARDERAATAREREQPNPLPGGRGSPDADTLAVIDAELAALPHQYRAAFVACDLNGRSRSEAARELGWPEGTVAARLAKARELLAARLTKRGITLGVGLFAAVAVPVATSAETLNSVWELLAVGTASAVAPSAQTLSDEVAKTMTTIHRKWLLLGGLVLALGIGGVVLLAGPRDKQPEREQIKAPVPKEPASEWKEQEPIKLPGYPVQNLAVSPDGKLLAAVTSNGVVSLYDPDTGERVDKNFLPQLKAQATRLDVSFSPEGKLAITGQNGVVAFDADTLRKDFASAYRSWSLWEGIPDFDPHRVVWLHEERTGGGWAAGEGRLVATDGVSFKEIGWTRGKREGEDLVRVEGETWEVRKGEKHAPTVLAAAPDVRRVFHSAGPDDKAAEKFDLFVREAEKQPHTVHTLSGHAARPASGAISADGKLMVSGDEAGTVIAWDGEKFKELGRWKLGGAITNVVVASDNRTAAMLRVSETTDGEGSTSWELFVFDATAAPEAVEPIWRATLPGLYSKSAYRLPETTGRGDAGPYRATLAFHPNGKKLFGSLGSPYLKTRRDDPNPPPRGIRVWELVAKK